MSQSTSNSESTLNDAFEFIWRVGKGWVFVLVATLLSLVLGYWGFEQYGAEKGKSYTPLDLMYLSWQLFPLQSGAIEGPVPWQIEIARVLAPMTAAYAVVKLLIEFLRERLRSLRLAVVRDHVVICGLGRHGMQLASECEAQGRRVLLIESSSNADGIATAQENGWLVVHGDATQTETLRRAHIERAHTLVTVCGDDGTNIEIALRARDIVSTLNGHRKGDLDCRVQVTDFAFAMLFKEHGIVADTADKLDISVFNSYENAARQVLNEHPLDREYIRADDPRQVHFVIFGFGQMGESLAVQAAKIGHFANERPIRITVIDRNANARRRAFLVRYPYFDHACEVEFTEAECEDPDTMRRVEAIASDPGVLASIAICYDNDTRAIQYALGVRRRLQTNAVPILTRINQDIGLSRLFDSTGSNASMFSFGSTRDSCSWELVKGEGLDKLARLIHEDYVAKQRMRGSPESPSTAPWERLSPNLRDSNRQQADHLPVKLRALGYAVRSVTEIELDHIQIPDCAIEAVARMEHARWNAERFLNGWTLGEKNVALRRSPYLVPFVELPDDIKKYDYDTVRNIPALLRAAKSGKRA